MADMRSGSQQEFQKLKSAILEKMPEEKSEIATSFSAFCSWLTSCDPEAMRQAKDIAISDIRLWRDHDDVLRHLWDQIYRH